MKKKVFLILITGYLIAWVMSNQLPHAKDILPFLYKEPLQSKTLTAPFKVQKGGFEYTVTPLYKYDLYGLVVTEHDTQGWSDYYHEQWKDKINIKDVCVIWGDNVKDDNFRKMKYSSGSWTCYYKANDGDVYQRFNNNQLSNNHLIFKDHSLGKVIKKVKRGDQIHFEGYLASYARGEMPPRKSSVTRTDRGNGACEVVFVKDFEILKEGSLFWRLLRELFKWAIFLIAGFSVYRFYRNIDVQSRRHKKGARKDGAPSL